jgi:hypothetical protein
MDAFIVQVFGILHLKVIPTIASRCIENRNSLHEESENSQTFDGNLLKGTLGQYRGQKDIACEDQREGKEDARFEAGAWSAEKGNDGN